MACVHANVETNFGCMWAKGAGHACLFVCGSNRTPQATFSRYAASWSIDCLLILAVHTLAS